MKSDFHTQGIDWDPSSTIPKIVYRAVPAISQTAPKITKNFDDLMESNPDWKQIVFDDVSQDNYIRSQCTQQVVDAYFQLNPAYGPARADLFRYLIIHQYGGVYLDQKSGVVARLNQLIQPYDQFLLAPTDPAGKIPSPHKKLRAWSGVEYMQWFIAAAPGHPFLAAVINRVLSNIHHYRPLYSGVGKKGVLNVTGPIAYTMAIAPILEKFSHRRIDAYKEGWRYTMLDSAVEHYCLSPIHYSKLSSPVVLMRPKIKLLEKILLQTEVLAAGFFGKLSVLNHERLRRRRRTREQSHRTI